MKTMTRNLMLTLAGALALSTSAHAASVSGSGCNKFGAVSYVYVNAGASLLIIDGGACFANGLTAGEQATLGAIASEGRSSGRLVAVGTGASMGGGTANGLSVAMQ